MLSSLLSEHIRRVNILVQLEPGQVDFPLYKPGESPGAAKVPGYDYSGKLVNLRIQTRRTTRLDFWLQNPIGIRWFIARNVDAKNDASLLLQDIKAGLYLASDVLLGCSLSQGQRISTSDEIAIYGFSEERGVSQPRSAGGGGGGAAWGSVEGNIAQQEDLINILDEKLNLLEFNEALIGVDAQAGELENFITQNASRIAALQAHPALAPLSPEPPAEPVDGQLWQESNADANQALYPWAWRWNEGQERWVSAASWLQSVLTNNASNYKSGDFSSRYPQGFAELWIPAVQLRGYLNNGGQTGKWKLELKERTSQNAQTTWLTVLSEGQPYNELWSAELPIDEIRPAELLGYAYKVSPVTKAGSVQFHAVYPVHAVRPI